MSQNRSFAPITIGLLLVLVVTFFVTPAPAAAQSNSNSSVQLTDFNAFASSVSNGQPESLRGIFVSGVLAFPIVQQPANSPEYVSPVTNTVTQFALTRGYGSIGLLAHNYLAGKSFSNLLPGQAIRVVYGDSHYTEYTVTRVFRFQALDPQNPNSDFIDQDTGEKISAATLFNRMYTGNNTLTLQTCISVNGDLSWGRLFVLAEPVAK
jgi:hypothetical protein